MSPLLSTVRFQSQRIVENRFKASQDALFILKSIISSHEKASEEAKNEPKLQIFYMLIVSMYVDDPKF